MAELPRAAVSADVSALSLQVLEAFKHSASGAGHSRDTVRNGVLSARLSDELDRFQLWAGNLGACHASGDSRSLTHRLRNAPELQRRALSLLNELIDLLASAPPLDGPHHTAERDARADLLEDEGLLLDMADLGTSQECQESWLVASVADTITRLFKLSHLLAKFTSTDRFTKAESAKLPQLDPRHDVARMHDKFATCQAPGWLLNRLGQANTKRRQALLYCREHRDKIAGPPKQTRHFSGLLEPGHDAGLAQQALSEYTAEMKTQISHLSAVQTTASTLKPIESIPVDDGFDDSRSFSTVATSVAGTDSQYTLRVPRLEDLGSIGEHFQCPLCCTIQRFNGQLSWRRHVFADIRPYICTFAECGMLLFDSKHAWTSHEMDHHRRHWICEVCNSHRSDDDNDFAVHLRTKHKGQFTGSQIQILMRTSSRTTDFYSALDCQFCEWEKTLRPLNTHVPQNEAIRVTSHHFMKHLATHLEQIALFALPRLPSDDAEDNSADAAMGASADTGQAAGRSMSIDDMESDADGHPVSHYPVDSEEHSANGTHGTCYCGQSSYGEMVSCGNGSCLRTQFHLACIELDQVPARGETWFCSACRGASSTMLHEPRGLTDTHLRALVEHDPSKIAGAHDTTRWIERQGSLDVPSPKQPDVQVDVRDGGVTPPVITDIPSGVAHFPSWRDNRSGQYYCAVKECKDSGNAFPNESSLRKHQRWHVPQEQYPYVCSAGDCGERFLFPAYLAWHQENKHRAGGLPYYCQECGQESRRYDELVGPGRHMDQLHPGARKPTKEVARRKPVTSSSASSLKSNMLPSQLHHTATDRSPVRQEQWPTETGGQFVEDLNAPMLAQLQEQGTSIPSLPDLAKPVPPTPRVGTTLPTSYSDGKSTYRGPGLPSIAQFTAELDAQRLQGTAEDTFPAFDQVSRYQSAPTQKIPRNEDPKSIGSVYPNNSLDMMRFESYHKNYFMWSPTPPGLGANPDPIASSVGVVTGLTINPLDGSARHMTTSAFRPESLPTTGTYPLSFHSDEQRFMEAAFPKVLCGLCDEHPDGFHGTMDLKQHVEGAHPVKGKVWICTQPRLSVPSAHAPERALDTCKQCKEQKGYQVSYNAAAHLRRVHFVPPKRGRRSRGEESERRAGKSDWPSIEWLEENGWLRVIDFQGVLEGDQQSENNQSEHWSASDKDDTVEAPVLTVDTPGSSHMADIAVPRPTPLARVPSFVRQDLIASPQAESETEIADPSQAPLAFDMGLYSPAEPPRAPLQQCPIATCGRYVKHLAGHMTTHHSKRPEKCPVPSCEYHDRGFARKYDRDRHARTHYNGTISCGFCPGAGTTAETSFSRADVFKRHLTAVHHAEQAPPDARRKAKNSQPANTPAEGREGSNSCTICDMVFTAAQDLMDHLDECVLQAVTRQTQERPQQHHLDPQQPGMSQESSGKDNATTSTPSESPAVAPRHHDPTSPLLARSHEEPYVCQTCQSRFQRLHDLKRHVKLHTGKKAHRCDKCGRQFARGVALARHNEGPGGCAGQAGPPQY
ncbi:hypothetical protein LTR53_000614 [Teratosphaeriaceae sp. CCFEE 6253]|nr:hypothetical protein LTR53_000614 [Teratosphaeriaceae sp. CCFEE 6253]